MTSLFNTDYAEIRVTQNMLDKRIIYANKSVIKLFDDTYDNLTNGDGITFKGEYFYNNSPSSIRCYKVKSRGDKQINISGLNKYVEAGDVIGIFKRVEDEQFHNRTPFSIVKVSAWEEDEMEDLQCALFYDGLIKDEPN